MTYRKLNEIAEYKLDHGEITMGEFDEMTKPLDEEIRIWIPCSERLPDKFGIYIVTNENGVVFEHNYNDITMHGGAWWSYCGRKIVAWMPLPEPYKKAGEAE